MAQIGFKIDGEWLTNFVRTWFWVENKSYETCEKLLLQSLTNPNIPTEKNKRNYTRYNRR